MNKEQYDPIEERIKIDRGIHPSVRYGKNVIVGLDIKIGANVHIGSNVFIGHNTHIREGSVILDGVGIRTHCLIDPEVVIGEGSQIYPQATVGGGTRVGENVYFGPYSLTTNSSAPGVVKPPVIKDNVTVYAGCMIGPNLIIGEHAILGMGSVLTKTIPDRELWYGNPARFVRKLDIEEEPIWPYSEKSGR